MSTGYVVINERIDTNAYFFSVLLQCIHTVEDIQGGPKTWHHFVRLNFTKIATDFQNYFTVRIRRKFVVLNTIT